MKKLIYLTLAVLFLLPSNDVFSQKKKKKSDEDEKTEDWHSEGEVSPLVFVVLDAVLLQGIMVCLIIISCFSFA